KLSKSMHPVFCIMTMLSTRKVDVPISSVTIHHRLRDSSPSYISKILRKLVVSGLINSVSGNNGGFTLAKDPEEINLLDIVEAVEGKIDTYPDSDLIHT
ncbi:Rrf2 family transcriptional regulator, partial [Escherichia coli]|nr:Rrf2 family transcriptional regulator [Escherichia coli]